MKEEININISRGMGLLFWILVYFYWYEWMERSAYHIVKGINNASLEIIKVNDG